MHCENTVIQVSHSFPFSDAGIQTLKGFVQVHGIHNIEGVRWLAFTILKMSEWLASTLQKMSYGQHSHSRRCPIAGNLEVCYDNRPTSLSVFRSVTKKKKKSKCELFIQGSQRNFIVLFRRPRTVQKAFGIQLIINVAVCSFFPNIYFSNTCLPNPTTSFASFTFKKIFLKKQC